MGLELTRYRVATSNAARLQRILAVNKVDLVLDVGANTGQFAREIRTCGYQGSIVSFEPLSAAHQALVHRSRRDARWTVAPPVAIGASDGAAEIHMSENSVSSSVLDVLDSHIRSESGAAFVGHETVKMARLDSIASPYLDASECAFLKVDTQGYEGQVLEGARESLKRIVGVQLELSLFPLYKGQPLWMDLVASMRESGFVLCGVVPGFADEHTGILLQFDGLFLRASVVSGGR